MRITASIASLTLVAACSVNTPTAAPSPPQQFNESYSYSKGAIAGSHQKIDSYSSLNPDCTSPGQAKIRITTPPQYGQITAEEGLDYANYKTDTTQAKCTSNKTPAMIIYYTSDPTSVGSDYAKIEILFPSGTFRTVEYKISVRQQ
jgi:hypothetical protein